MFWLLTKKGTWITLGILILILVIWIWWRSRPAQVTLPDDKASGNDSLSQTDQQTVRSISQGLYRILRGWAWDIFFRDPDPFSQWLNLSDTMFVAVYNDFNYAYGGGKGTLRQWLEDDVYFSKSVAGTLYQQVILRMDRLNLP